MGMQTAATIAANSPSAVQAVARRSARRSPITPRAARRWSRNSATASAPARISPRGSRHFSRSGSRSTGEAFSPEVQEGWAAKSPLQIFACAGYSATGMRPLRLDIDQGIARVTLPAMSGRSIAGPSSDFRIRRFAAWPRAASLPDNREHAALHVERERKGTVEPGRPTSDDRARCPAPLPRTRRATDRLETAPQLCSGQRARPTQAPLSAG